MEIDRTSFDHKGVTFTILVQHDYDAKPTDYECYTDADQEAWVRGDWQYVGVQLVIDDHHGFDLWALEYGHIGEVWIGTTDLVQRAKDEGWCDEAVSDVLPVAERAVERLRKYKEEDE